MIEFNKVPETGDPASNQQLFEKLKLNVLCCRYWWLDEWQSEKMTFPYWRLYWNKNKGAYVIYKQTIELTPDTILIIPPYTPFSTLISGKNLLNKQAYNLKGGWIHTPEEETEYEEQGSILHFFIHFNLGFPYDHFPAGLYSFKVTSDIMSTLHAIKSCLLSGKPFFRISESLQVYHLIITLVNQLPSELWQKNIADVRIKEIIEFMESNPALSEDNAYLASRIKMAPNSFARLFKENVGMTPHAYLNQVRIDKACDFLHHSNMSIDKIAEQCGFFDRYHFSKMFKKTMNITPAEYRKGLNI